VAQHERAQKAAQLRQEDIDNFNANREQIIAFVNKAISEKDYQSALTLSGKYLVTNDAELKEIYARAESDLAAIQKAEETERILKQLKTIPEKDYSINKSLYQQLMRLHPDNDSYKTKVAFYTSKIVEEKQKQAAAIRKLQKIESQFTWDGAHRNLERIIKESMHDPDSYKHVKTVYWERDNHLIVWTTVRGTNAFGGVITNTVRAKVSIDGIVLQILN